MSSITSSKHSYLNLVSLKQNKSVDEVEYSMQKNGQGLWHNLL